ncbi:hypothetical protein [Nocardia neocaledoniensis]|uniref:hypothetical protein n=1 Tax=Nocardia neocaledoniensis TaxID=236511 RepID=UPI0024537977|nr:hypothetical protein [Nocardia neocaledoniensis]
MTPPSADEIERTRLEYWRAATYAVPAGTGIGIVLFALLAGIADGNSVRSDPSAAVLASVASAALCVAAVVIGVIKRTAVARGIATGLVASALLVGYAGLMLR